MSFRTWDEVVRPAFSGHFEIEAQPYFALLPTFTLYARSSLLGGCLPGEGLNNQGEPTTNEPILVAKNLGLSPEEAKTRLRFQYTRLNLDDFITKRELFTDEEWLDLPVQSIGFNPARFTQRVKMLMMLRLIPFVESNYGILWKKHVQKKLFDSIKRLRVFLGGHLFQGE